MPALFARAERLVVLDSTLSTPDAYTIRTVHFPYAVIARSRFIATGAGQNAAQLRSWGGTGPPNTPSEWFVVTENEFVADTPSTAVVRTCSTNTCDSSTATSAPVRNGIFRDNVLRITGTSAAPPSIGFWVAGSDLTIEGNTVEALGVSMAGPGQTRVVQQYADRGGAGDRIQVRGNRAFVKAGTRGAVACDVPAGSGHACDGNVIERR